MRPRVDLVYFDSCPHVDAAREALRRALTATGSRLAWREWSSDDPNLPAFARGYGSPSIFVGEREVTGAAPAGSASSCRVYRGQNGVLRGAPDPVAIMAALQRARR